MRLKHDRDKEDYVSPQFMVTSGRSTTADANTVACSNSSTSVRMAWVDAWTFVLLLVASFCPKTREEVIPLDDEGDADTMVEYTAAVLEHEAYNSWVSGGLAILQENTRLYLEYAALAKEQGADIMVFPEYGLTSTNLAGDFITLTQVLPDPTDLTVPCDLPGLSNYTLVVRELSCGAAQLGMYLVVDLAEQEPCTDTPHGPELDAQVQAPVSQPVTPAERSQAMEDRVTENPGDKDETEGQGGGCPSSGYYIYNSQVVFDRAGAVVARYRKKHLFLESQFTPGNEDDASAVFTTDFGVTFTLQVCFDIMYESPGLNNVVQRGVRDVAMSTAWMDELPFLTAPQIFNGWSAGLGVNLLVANYHNATYGGVGSGIFRGVTWQAPDYTYDPSGGTTLLVGSVSTLVTPRGEHRTGLSQSTPGSQTENVDGLSDGAGDTEDTSQLQSVSSAAPHIGGISQQPYPATVADQANYYKHLTSEEDRPLDVFFDDLSCPENEVKKEQLQTKDEFIFLHEDLGYYNHEVLDRSEKEIIYIKNLCHNDSLCCMIVYTYPFNETEEGLYMILAYSGVVQKGGGVYGMFTQVCAIVFCLNDDVNSCAHVEGENPRPSSFRAYDLSGTFTTPYVYPSVFTQDMTLINETVWTFDDSKSKEKGFFQVSLNENVPSLLSLTMFGRWYERDPDL